MTLTLLSRSYCHLCDEMREALLPIAERYGAVVAEFDVDADSSLEAPFGERVPVVLLGGVEDGIELCHFRIDRAHIEAILAGNRA